jgi:uncharacterized membrane protein YgcG
MLWRWGSFVTCVVLLVLSVPGVAVATAGQERILTYAVSAEVQVDGVVVVTERIRYHFADPRHGIFRFIPLYYPLVDSDGNADRFEARKLEIVDYSATMDGQDVPFVEDTAASGADTNFVLRVGDENREVTGDHDYRLDYRLRGMLNAPGGRPELFWDALGKESNIPVDHAEVTVTAPGPIGRVRCVVGGGECGTTRVTGESALFMADGIGANKAVTVTVGLPDTVVVPPPIMRASRTLVGRSWDNLVHPGREVGMPVLVAVIVTMVELALCALVGLRSYRSRGRTSPEPLVMRSEPPTGVPAGLCGLLLRGKVNRGAAAAVLTDMAVRGVLTITEVPGGFQVAWVGGRKKIRHKVHRYERPIVSTLSDPVTLTGKRKDSVAFSRALGTLPERLADEAVRRGWFTVPPLEARKVRITGVMILVLSAVALIIAGLAGLAWWLVPVVLVGLVLCWKPHLVLRGRTTLGSAARSQVVGFRQFLQTAELGQFAGDDLRAVFNRYLPYALAFGLAERWAAKFAAAGITPDRWFTGNTNDTSDADYLTFTSKVSSVSTSPITVSSSTGSSSSGSGGVSSGGGGVGSW